MINVVASIHVKDGRLSEFVEIFKSNVPAVLDEEGCVEYVPTIDLMTGLPAQDIDGATVTIIEKWNTLDDLNAHLEAPHMLAFRKRVEGMVEKVALKVLQPA